MHSWASGEVKFPFALLAALFLQDAAHTTATLLSKTDSARRASQRRAWRLI